MPNKYKTIKSLNPLTPEYTLVSNDFLDKLPVLHDNEIRVYIAIAREKSMNPFRTVTKQAIRERTELSVEEIDLALSQLKDKALILN